MPKQPRLIQRSLHALLTKLGAVAALNDAECASACASIREHCADLEHCALQRPAGRQPSTLIACASLILDAAGWCHTASNSSRSVMSALSLEQQCLSCIAVAALLVALVRTLQPMPFMPGSKHPSAPERQEWLAGAAQQLLERWLTAANTTASSSTATSAVARAAAVTCGRAAASDPADPSVLQAAAAATLQGSPEGLIFLQMARRFLEVCNWLSTAVEYRTPPCSEQELQAQAASWCRPPFLRLAALVVRADKNMHQGGMAFAVLLYNISSIVFAHAHEQRVAEKQRLMLASSQPAPPQQQRDNMQLEASAMQQQQQQQHAGSQWQQWLPDAQQSDMAAALKDVEVVFWLKLQQYCSGLWQQVVKRHRHHPTPLTAAALAAFGATGARLFTDRVNTSCLTDEDCNVSAAAMWPQMLLGHATHVGLWGQLVAIHEALGTHPADITSTPADAGSSSSSENNSSSSGGNISSRHNSSSSSSDKGGTNSSSGGADAAAPSEVPEPAACLQALMFHGRMWWPLLACPAVDSSAAGMDYVAAEGSTSGCGGDPDPGRTRPGDLQQQQQLQLALQYMVICYELEAWNELKGALLLLLVQLRQVEPSARVRFLASPSGALLLQYAVAAAEGANTEAAQAAQRAAAEAATKLGLSSQTWCLLVQEGCAELQNVMLNRPRCSVGGDEIPTLASAVIAWAFLEPCPPDQQQAVAGSHSSCQTQQQRQQQEQQKQQQPAGKGQEWQQQRQWVSCLGREAVEKGGVLVCNRNHPRGALVLVALQHSQLQLVPGYTPSVQFLLSITAPLLCDSLPALPLSLLEVVLGPCVSTAVSASSSRDVSDGMWTAMGWVADKLSRSLLRHVPRLQQLAAQATSSTAISSVVSLDLCEAAIFEQGVVVFLVCCCRVLIQLLQAALTAVQQPAADLPAVQLAAGAQVLAGSCATLAEWYGTQLPRLDMQHPQVAHHQANSMPAAAAAAAAQGAATAGGDGAHDGQDTTVAPASGSWPAAVTGLLHQAHGLLQQLAAVSPGGQLPGGGLLSGGSSADVQQQAAQTAGTCHAVPTTNLDRSSSSSSSNHASPCDGTSSCSSNSKASSGDVSGMAVSTSAGTDGAVVPRMALAAQRVLSCCRPRLGPLGCAHAGCANLNTQFLLLNAQRGVRSVCGGCRLSRYCSVECQAADWECHRQVCGRLQRARQHCSS